MTYLGTMKGGVVVFEGESKPPEGAKVRVDLAETDAERIRELREGLLELAASTKQVLPTDASRNVDHYLYGAPKK